MYTVRLQSFGQLREGEGSVRCQQLLSPKDQLSSSWWFISPRGRSLGQLPGAKGAGRGTCRHTIRVKFIFNFSCRKNPPTCTMYMYLNLSTVVLTQPLLSTYTLLVTFFMNFPLILSALPVIHTTNHLLS